MLNWCLCYLRFCCLDLICLHPKKQPAIMPALAHSAPTLTILYHIGLYCTMISATLHSGASGVTGDWPQALSLSRAFGDRDFKNLCLDGSEDDKLWVQLNSTHQIGCMIAAYCCSMLSLLRTMNLLKTTGSRSSRKDRESDMWTFGRWPALTFCSVCLALTKHILQEAIMTGFQM